MKFRTLFFLYFIFLYHLSFSQNWNIELLRKINLERNPSFDDGLRKLTNSITYTDIGTPAILFTVASIRHDSLGKRKAIYVGSSLLLSAAISGIIKKTVKEPRPFVTYPEIQKLTKAGSESFPSGHTTDAFSMATSLTIAYPKWYVAVPAYTYASAIGYSRMHLGVHYPGDVLAGAIIGSGTAFLTHKINYWLAQK
ncbi:MAG: phosphatase PAP2 family protein [Cytophagaceae bacterium]|nr:phosphatase PAP2 family protein [Cytophagaceae bacterium]MBL0301494.1 phosphatase PAP2 family protein [Cytophagaceae bacterium]MBL0324315.1 phosphatase PAP2 family protein [Cytophagaceae bacterium]